MTVHVLLESKIKTNHAAELIPFIEENLDNVRGFDGCSHVDILFDEAKSEILFNEVWESPAHHQQYIQSISESGVMATLVGHLEEPPTVKYYYHSEL